jgi:hypothetical protein
MGTSGAYGGSGSQTWADVHEAIADLDTSTTSDGKPSKVDIEKAVDKILDAIGKVNPSIKKTPTEYTISDLRRGASVSGGAISSGTGRGRSSGFSHDTFARGAAAIGAGLAYTSGSDSELRRFGLSISELQGLNTRDRCKRILDEVLGAPGHLDDELLRKAALEALKEMFSAVEELSGEQSLRTFLAAYVYQCALAELTSQKAAKSLAPAAVLKHEKDLKSYIGKRVKFERILEGSRLSIQAFVNKAAKMTAQALKMVGVITS